MTSAAAIREPKREQALRSTDLDAFAQRHAQLAALLAQVESSRDVARLAQDAERSQWQALDDAEKKLASMPAGPERDAFAERVRLLRGVLLWDLDRAFKLRAANTARDLRQAGRELRDARQRLDAIVAAGDLVPRKAEGFAQRVTELSARVERIGPAIDAVALAQERVLADLAVRELQAQKRRLANYATQAQFALASLHDGASTAGGGR